MPIDPKKHYPIAALLASWSHPGNLLPNDASGERVAQTCINDLRDAIEAEVGILNEDIEHLRSLEGPSDWARGYIDGVRKAVALLRMVDRPSLSPVITYSDDRVPMLLWCPACGERHIDEGAFAPKSHHTHACQTCGMVWRPAIVPTVGVQFLPGFSKEKSSQ